MIIPAKSIILASIGKPISDTTEGKKNEKGGIAGRWKKILLPKTGETNDPIPPHCVLKCGFTRTFPGNEAATLK